MNEEKKQIPEAVVKNRKWKALILSVAFTTIYMIACVAKQELIQLWGLASTQLLIFGGYLGVNVAQKHIQNKK